MARPDKESVNTAGREVRAEVGMWGRGGEKRTSKVEKKGAGKAPTDGLGWEEGLGAGWLFLSL